MEPEPELQPLSKELPAIELKDCMMIFVAAVIEDARCDGNKAFARSPWLDMAASLLNTDVKALRQGYLAALVVTT